MTNLQNISIHDYTYFLPEERIAKYPLPERDASRLLIYKDEAISEDIYKNISGHIPSHSLLIFNNTKVVEARLLFQKPGGGSIEIFCLEPHAQYPDITAAMLQKEKVLWHCLIGGASKWKAGQVLEKRILNNHTEIILTATYIEKKTDTFIIELSWGPAEVSFAEILHHAGAIPLPPYIKRKPEQTDAERYQTVYAEQDGSVAAPTAGLHFTDSIFETLSQKNIQKDFVTLHVGAGTFKPVKADTLQEHEMHAEYIDVSKKTIEKIIATLDKNIIAVGTTSLRTIESLYWLGQKPELRSGYINRTGIPLSGNKIGSGDPLCGMQLSQWEPYQQPQENISAKEAMQSLLQWMQTNKLERLKASTQIIIVPGYRFRIVDALITNFHQPQSTLLLLVAAFCGEKGWRKIYDHALKNDFRFLSYGDGCLLWKQKD